MFWGKCRNCINYRFVNPYEMKAQGYAEYDKVCDVDGRETDPDDFCSWFAKKKIFRIEIETDETFRAGDCDHCQLCRCTETGIQCMLGYSKERCPLKEV